MKTKGLQMVSNAWKYTALVVLLFSLGTTSAWAGGGGGTTYYANLTINKTGETGKGKVYYATSDSRPSSETSGALKSAGSTTQNANQTYYWWVDVDPGYNVTLSGKITAGPATAATLSGNVACAQSSSSGSGTSYSATANIVAVTVDSVTPTSKDLAPTDPSADYPFTVTFTTSNLKTIALDLNKSPETADGKFTITNWSLDGTNVVATGKFNGGGTYGGASRNNSTTISLQSKASGSAAKTCTVTANFPALEFVGATETDVFTTTNDATKTGSAVFNFNYGAADDFTSAPTFTHTSGAGAFTVVGDPVIEPDFSAGTCKVTVNYTFNPNGTAGTTKEELKITSVGGLVSSVTVTGEAEAEATDDAKVIAADGTTLIYQGDWATALSKANTATNAGCTLQLLRDVDLGTLAATQSVTNTFTLDLNGKTLRGTVSSSVPRLLYVNKASKTLTIIDSKTGGKISATGSYANALYGIQINNGNVILNSGSIEITNENTSQTTADRLYATGVYVNSGKTFTMNGGSITANRGARDAYGIYVAASATARGKATINNGTINVNAKTYGYGIRGYGDIIINDGTINVNNTASYPFGVYVRASANATASSGIAGSLTMSGGTINSTATTTYAYGIYMQTSTVGTGETETPEGTHSNQECGVLKITGGTIRVINDGNVASTNQYAYGIYMDGDYSSKSAKHITQTIKNLNLYVEGSRYIYGIYATAGAQTNSACNQADVSLTDNTVEVVANATTTAYAVYVGAASRTIYTAGSAVYAGEYATAAKVTINSGTYTARTTTTTAYAVCSATRAKTTFAPDTTLGGNAEAYPTIIIKGGEFNAYPTTTTARAVSSGGNTTITGGTFNAIAGTSTAYGIYSVAGDLNVTGVEVNAEATGTAVGVYVDCAVASITGFSYYTNATLKNLTVTATTRTGAEADGVMIANYKRNLTEATLKSDSTNNKWSAASYLMYKKIYNYGEFAVAPKCTIIGGTYTAKAATTTAYGVRLNGPAISADSDGDGNVAVAYGQLDIDNAEIIAQTNGTTTCYGVWAGGPTTINRCNITASSKTTTCCGLLIEAGKTTLTNSTITATGDATVRGIYVNARIAAVSSTQNVNTEFAGVAGMECIGELEATNNTVTATATNGNTAYGIYLHAVKGNTASGPFAGDHAIAGKATINSGKYTATATGTTAYALGMAAQQNQGGVIARPEITVNNGKFWGKADGGTDGCVHGNGQMNYVVLKGGFYNVNTNLSKYVYEGLNVNGLSSGSEYDEGYRFTISSGTTGDPVCKVYQNGSTDKGSFATLKEALQFVNSNTANTYTVVMIANHTLPAGNYIIPSKVTLIVPDDKSRKSAMGTTPTREQISTPAPVQAYMLTFDAGVNMTVYGGIETTAKQNAAAGGSAISGAPHGNYGRLHLVEGSKITLESGSNFNCWGYCTGKGEITAMSGSTVREGFQLGYWRGGTATSSMMDNKSTWKAFPVTDYFIQNVESPIIFRPGSQLKGYSAVTTTGLFSDLMTHEANDVAFVGTSSAMFLMESKDASADTWVKKEYDAATDRGIWTVNSGAKLGQLSFSLSGQTVNSGDYYLPISNNMTIYLNEGEFTVTQDALLIPGAQIIISKLGKLTVSSGKSLFVMDNEDWPGFRKKGELTTVTRYYYNATYSPSWTTNPRTLLYPPTTTPLPDAEIFVHGTTEGQYYTTEHGANIHSTNEDAGVVRFVAAAGANKSIKHVVNTNCDLFNIDFTSAKLKNEVAATPYTSTAGTVAGDAYTYMDYMWVNVKENGCLLTKTDGTGTHDLAHPSDVVAVVANSDDNAYHSETGSRKFIFAEKKVTTAGCVWWEAEKVTTGDHVGDYMANKEQFDNYGGYYYWDGSAGYWKPRTVTVTWKNYDGTALATYSNVQYNTSPHYSSASPKVPANSNIATYAWTGWDDPDGNFYSKDEPLPRATGNITYTAHIQENKFEYLITFKNAAGKVMYSAMFEAGTMPECPEEYLVQAPTTSQVFSTPVTWSPALASVTGSQTYTATFTASPRKYTVTFVDYDMSFLADTLINYNDYAVYPALADEPYRESTDAYSYDWLGWTKTLAKVTKDVTYVAKYKQTTIKYKVVFKSDCWGQNDGDEGCVEKIHSQKDYALGATVVVPANPSRTATAQYTYTFDHWDPAVGPVEVGGATYTAVYTKTPRAYAITYKDKDNKTFTGTHGSNYPTTHTYNTSETLVDPTKTGYNFEGWYSVADCSSGKITKIPADVAAAYTVYANWTPKTNTAYTVKHFKQNIDGTYNTTPDETDNLTGTTGASVTPDGKDYTGFKTPAPQTKTILADGSLVIEYKYTRNSYKLTWALAGGKVTVAGTGAAVDATGSPYSTVKYDDAISAPTVTRAGYIFGGWDVTPAAKMPAEATTYTAQWTQAVASVAAEGETTTYYATVADAISAANALANPTVTMLQDGSVTSEVEITAAMTIDLNGKTISSTQTTAKTGVFKINAANETVTIRDGGSGGKIEHIANCTGYLYGINLFAGSLNMEGGYIYAENTKDAASSSSYRACGIMYASDYTNPASVTMSGGIVEAKRKRTYAYGICLYTANCELTMTGGEVKASGTGNIRGIYMGGTAKLTNVSVSATATGTNNCYAIFSDSNGAFTINSGTYTATGEGTDVYPISVTKASNASVGGSVTVNGGRFSGKDKELYVSGGTAILQGGYYVHNTDLASNCATNYHVFNLAGQSPYLYEVAEGYKVTWDATTNGGTCATPYTVVKKGNTIGALPVATKDNYSFDGWFTTYTGAGGNQVATTTVINFAITYYARFTPNTYNITYKNKDNAAFNGTHEDGYPTTHTYGTETPLDSPTRTGYTFEGYYTSSDCSTGKVTSLSATGYTSAITLYANWTPNVYNITYLDQNGAAFSGVHGDGYPTTHTYATATTLVSPTKVGYVFKGWYTAADCASGKVTSLAATTYTADVTLYALWTESTTTPYTVEHYQQNIVDDNYTLFATENKTGTTGAVVTPAVKSYTGFTVPSTQTKTIAADGLMVIKYYYTRNSYELTWDANGGSLSGTYTSGTVKFGATITAPTATRTGYTFSAWSPALVETMPASAKSFKATWTCVSPSNLTIASEGNKWDFCAGETMTLTVSGDDIATDAKYQWKKWNGSAWANISGATSASYSVTMAAANALQYSCEVKNGTCATQSDGVWVRVWQLYINNGASNGWKTLDFTNTGTNTGSNANVALTADKTYQFKLKDNTGGWFGLNDKTVTRTEGAFALNGTGADVNITAGMTGDYTFTINYADKNNPTIAITYPVADQPAGKNIYFDKSVIADWGDKIYYRIGHPTYNTNNGDNAWTLVPGTDNFYTTQTIKFDGFEAWQIANNASWSGDNSIYKVDGSGFAITRATDFQKYVVGDQGVTIVPTEFHNTETGCDYWHVAVTDGMLSHKATITAPAHGTITIANDAQSLSATATTANLPHRTILTITATPAEGYQLSTLTVNGATFTSGNTHILSADATIAATFVPITYTIRFNANGGEGSMSDESFNYTEEKALTSNSFTRTGYTFEGWATSAGGSVVYTDGKKVINLSTVDGTVIDLYAIWSLDDTGPYLDIVDWTDDATNGTTLTLNLNGIPASGWPYTINGTEYQKTDRAADRTLTIPRQHAADWNMEILVVGQNGVYSKHSYTIPRVYNENASVSGSHPSAILYVRNGVTLTITDETSVNAIFVAPQAELVVNSGVALTVDTLVLRTTPWKAAVLENQGTITAKKTYYTRQVADNSGYFQFALPLASTIEDAHLSDYSKCTYGKSWILKSYSESSRAKNGDVNTETTSNWILLEKQAEGKTTIAATTGYELYSNSQYYREFYFPVNLKQAGKTTSVTVTHTHYEDGAGKANEGWNAICSPLLGKFVQDFGANPEEGLKVSELLDNGQYWQHVLPVIYPAIPFYYQAPKNGKLDFSTKLMLSAPRRAWNASVPTQWLQLTINDDKGRMLDETSIYTHPEKFEADYETGYDVAKQSLTGGKATIYTELACGKLAFAAIPDSIAETRVPVTVYAGADKEYTFSMRENNYLTRLQYVLLHDTETGAVTDLLQSDYTCELTQGTVAGRFYIQCVFVNEASTVTTEVDNVSDDSQERLEKVQKILYQDKVYIIYQGRVYDMTGRQCELK